MLYGDNEEDVLGCLYHTSNVPAAAHGGEKLFLRSKAGSRALFSYLTFVDFEHLFRVGRTKSTLFHQAAFIQLWKFRIHETHDIPEQLQRLFPFG